MKLPRIHAALLLTLSTVACNSFGESCTLIGCRNGLSVVIQSAATLPYKIEVFKTTGTTLTLLKSTECTTQQCFGEVFVDDTTLTHVTVRVTTPTGTRETDFPNVKYNESHPNGRSCGPRCVSAQLVAPVP